MRVAIVSDIHGNLTAFDAVLADLRETAPDLVFHGGDLAHGGASSREVVDRIGELAWPGVVGNTDELLFAPESLAEFASARPHLQPVFAAIGEMADFTRTQLGDERLRWLQTLPRTQKCEELTLLHASPTSLWLAPEPGASDEELNAVFGDLEGQAAVYAHIHQPFIRRMPRLTVVNTGSVSLSYDGDRRASYLLLDDGRPSIRRVEYDVQREITAVRERGLPHPDWIARSLASAAPQMP